MSAYEANLRSAHQSLSAAKAFLNAASQQGPGDRRGDVEAMLRETEALVWTIFEFRFARSSDREVSVVES